MSYDTARRKYIVKGRLTSFVELGFKLVGALDLLLKTLGLDFCFETLSRHEKIFYVRSQVDRCVVTKSSRFVW